MQPLSNNHSKENEKHYILDRQSKRFADEIRFLPSNEPVPKCLKIKLVVSEKFNKRGMDGRTDRTVWVSDQPYSCYRVTSKNLSTIYRGLKKYNPVAGADVDDRN